MKKKYLLIIYLFLLLPSFGKDIYCQQKDVDGWREAKWGMTENQVLSAFKGEVKKYEKSIEYAKWDAPIGILNYVIKGYTFDVHFLFDKTKKILQQININGKGNSLDAREPTFEILGELLTEKYGAPSNRKNEKYIKSIVWNFPSTKIEIFALLFDTKVLNISYSAPDIKELKKI